MHHSERHSVHLSCQFLCFDCLMHDWQSLFQHRFQLYLLYLSILSPYPTPSIPPVFLHVSVVDIDQLKLIMMLVGTPGPKLMMKISSESVSVMHHPTQFLLHCPSCLCLCCLCVALARDGQSSLLLCINATTSKLHSESVSFLKGMLLSNKFN